MYEFLEYHVQDVMTTGPITLTEEQSLADAEALFEKHQFNSLPVVNGRSVVGLLNQLDLLKAFQFTQDSVFPPYEKIMASAVRGVMAVDVETTRPRVLLTKLLERMIRERRRSYPVIDGDDELIGIVTREDIIVALRRAVGGARPGGAG